MQATILIFPKGRNLLRYTYKKINIMEKTSLTRKAIEGILAKKESKKIEKIEDFRNTENFLSSSMVFLGIKIRKNEQIIIFNKLIVLNTFIG